MERMTELTRALLALIHEFVQSHQHKPGVLNSIVILHIDESLATRAPVSVPLQPSNSCWFELKGGVFEVTGAALSIQVGSLWYRYGVREWDNECSRFRVFGFKCYFERFCFTHLRDAIEKNNATNCSTLLRSWKRCRARRICCIIWRRRWCCVTLFNSSFYSREGGGWRSVL